MVGAIGSGSGASPAHRALVGDAPRLPARMIPKFGSVTLTWPEKHARASLTRLSPTAVVISMAGVETEITLREWPMPVVRGRQRGIRTRFVCPRCEASRDALHWIDGEWCCRGSTCGNLSHASRHQQRWCPAIRRRARLLRKLVRVPPRSLQARLLRAQIRREERAMLANLRWANSVLIRRRRRAGHGRVNPE
jgi:hypothetical protein